VAADLADAELAAERAHLQHARECLAEMTDAASAIADYAADALASESLGRLRAQRLAALTAEPDAPPFFGRTDRDAAPGSESAPGSRAEVLHIGRRHIRDEKRDPVVIDWRAPIALPFYRATAADRMGVALRRRFGFGSGPHAGDLTSYEDEHLDRGERLGLDSQILRAEIERPRVGPMRDIVATVQPDQDELVRADLDSSLCIQGAPGTGKTAVGLHRAAYLLYTYPQRLRRTGVLVVGPNAAFLHYIAQVLPALGESGIAQTTVDELVAHAPIRAVDPTAVAVLKGDARMAELLRRAVLSHIRRPVDDVVAMAGDRRYRIGAHYLLRFVDDARREFVAGQLRWNAARERIGMQLAEYVRRLREAGGGAPSDAETRRLARSRPVTAAVDAVWPALSAPALLARLWTDAEFLAGCGRSLTEAERASLRWTAAPRSVRAAKWAAADLVLLDELVGMLDSPDSYVHLVLDEAQDLSAMQCRAVGRRCALGSITVLGDLAQATTAWAPGSWAATLAHLGHPDAEVRPLTVGYRVPGEVLALSNRLLPHIAPELPPATSVRAGDGALSYAQRGQLREAVAGCLVADGVPIEGSIGVIAPDAAVAAVLAQLAELGAARLADDADSRITVVPASAAKGLEFDSVVLVEPADIAAPDATQPDAGQTDAGQTDASLAGLRRLYVALTRAVSRLVIVHDRPLPALLLA
jgi:DNA helicase IV